MLKRFCLMNDPETGGAVIGTIEINLDLITSATQTDDVKKAPGERPANWHHPQVPTLLRAVQGSHVIWVQNRGIANSITIEAGDEILFLDFETDQPVQAGSHPGHWSQQGAEGFHAHKYLLDPISRISELNFKPIG